MKPNRRIITDERLVFQRKSERLDWKRIASIDIDNLIQEGDGSQLEELLNPVTFCRADTEFDQDRIDPGFIKVFRLSQLISECLLVSHERCIERLTRLEEKYNDVGKEKEKLSEAILHLKDTLTSAKKELKKRKEMLASSQHEILGQNNIDEYDQCPYCAKKFLTGAYLLAHVQRRHQGLPINPLHPSLPPGTTMVHYHQPQPVSTNLPLHSGGSQHDMSQARSPQQIFPLGQQTFPVVNTPSSSILYGINQLAPNAPSFSGSVASLNQFPFNHVVNNSNSEGLCRRDSFTQTTIPNPVDLSAIVGNLSKYLDQKSIASLGLLPEMSKIFCHSEDEGRQSSEKNFSDSLTQSHIAHREKEGEGDNNNGDSESPFRENFRNSADPHAPNETDDRIAGPLSAGVGSSRSRERLEAAELDVIKMRDEFETQWHNLEEKVRQSGIEELKGAVISEAGKVNQNLINSSKRNCIEEGEVTKPSSHPIASIIPPTQVTDVIQKEELIELKRTLQAAIQDELKSLISRLESQEQFWEDKLASVQQDHEKQIQQVRRELQLQNARNDPTSNRNQATQENADVIVDDKSQSNEKDYEEEEEEEDDTEDITPPGGIILVGPKGHHKPKSLHSQQWQHLPPTSPTTCGVPRNTPPLDESRLPVAKPRKSKPAQEATLSSGVKEVVSNSVIIPTQVQPIIHEDPYLVEGEHRGTTVRLQSLSESEQEYLTVIQSEEFREGKHDNSIQPLSKSIKIQSSPTAMNTVFGGLNKSGRGSDGVHRREQKSDEVSEYTLSSSLDEGDDEQNDISSMSHSKNDSHQGSIDHPRGKSSAKQTPVKKKYIFDAKARKLVEVSPDEDEEEDDNEPLGDNGDANNTLNEDASKKGKKSQLDLVRAKTIMELEQQMTDIGLNPESTAIGLEEMGRALKHLKIQRRASADQIHNFEKFEEERNAVKTLAKFEATKSSIDGKLDAISTLSTKKTQQSSFGRIFSAVKTSGKNFRKRVASAVKKKSKQDDGDDDNVHKSEKKSLSAPPLKTTFFSKARWARKKKPESASTKSSANKETEEKTSDEDDSTDEESESGEEIEVSPFLIRTNNSIPRRTRESSRSAGSHDSSTRRKRSRSHSRPKSGKPLKRLNSNSGTNPIQLSSGPAGAGMSSADRRMNNNVKSNNNKISKTSPTSSRHSSESPPFSDIDEDEYLYESNDDDSEDKQKEEHFGNHSSNQKKAREPLENKDFQSQRQLNPQGNTVVNELKERLNGKTSGSVSVPTGERKKGITLPRTLNVESLDREWDDMEDEMDQSSANFTPGMNRLRTTVNADRDSGTHNNTNNKNRNKKEDFNDKDKHSGQGQYSHQRKSYVNAERRKEDRSAQELEEPPSWEKLSDTRLQEIKQIIDDNKKEIDGSDTSCSSEEDFCEDFAEIEVKGRKSERTGATMDNKNTERNTMSAFRENHNKRFETASHSQQSLGKLTDPSRYNYGQRTENDEIISSRFISSPKNRKSEIRLPKVPVRSLVARRLHFGTKDDDEFSNDDSSFRDTVTYTKDNANSSKHQRERESRIASGGGDRPSQLEPSETISEIVDSSEEMEREIRDLLDVTTNDGDGKGLKHRNSNYPPHSFPQSSVNLRKQQFSSTKTPPDEQRHNDLEYGSRGNIGTVQQRKLQPSREIKSPSNSWDSQK